MLNVALVFFASFVPLTPNTGAVAPAGHRRGRPIVGQAPFTRGDVCPQYGQTG